MKLNKTLIGLFSILAALSVSAATATINISGTVGDSTSITLSATTVNIATDLTLGLSDVALVTITEKSNKKNGYSLAITTLNAADNGNYFMSGAATSETIEYSLKHGGNTYSKDLDTYNYLKTSGAGDDFVLSITCAAGNYSADTYSDTITITVIARN